MSVLAHAVSKTEDIGSTKSIAPEYIGSGSSTGSLKLINMSTALDNAS
jgi:hypothetical protein